METTIQTFIIFLIWRRYHCCWEIFLKLGKTLHRNRVDQIWYENVSVLNMKIYNSMSILKNQARTIGFKRCFVESYLRLCTYFANFIEIFLLGYLNIYTSIYVCIYITCTKTFKIVSVQAYVWVCFRYYLANGCLLLFSYASLLLLSPFAIFYGCYLNFCFEKKYSCFWK